MINMGKKKSKKKKTSSDGRLAEVKRKIEKNYKKSSISPTWVTKANVGLGKVPEYQTDCLLYRKQEIFPDNPDTNGLEANSM